MQRLAVSIAFLSAVPFAGCSTQECTYLNDCPSAQVCSADGRCIADERPEALAVRNGNGEVRGGDDALDDDGLGDVGVGNVSTPEEALMSGRIGPVDGFEGPAVMSYWNDVDFGMNVINVTSQSDEGFGLFILSLANGIEALPVGTTTIGTEGLDDGATYVQLCADTADGGVHFDGIADETVVTVTPNEDNGFDVDVTTTITEGFEGWSYDHAEPTVLRVEFTLD
jgi:hypothetical protein